MSFSLGRLCRLVAVPLLALAALTPAASAGATGGPPAPPGLLNHTYTVLDRVTADAVAESAYLRDFGAFQLRTTTNGQTTYTGRYLLGRDTYLEMFGPGDLPAPDDTVGASGLALGSDVAGGLDVVKQRLVDEGVTEPLDVVQTKQLGADQVPWFRVVAAAPVYEATFPWVMEYLPSYFADPRVPAEPPSYDGDVSRERYNPDDYAQHLMRNVTGVELAMPQADVDTTALVLRAAGFRVRETRDGVLARGRDTVVRLVASTRADAGWREIRFDLTRRTPRHVEPIGNSTLVVGPGRRATWTFATAPGS